LVFAFSVTSKSLSVRLVFLYLDVASSFDPAG
jgi:hypothetical protein